MARTALLSALVSLLSKYLSLSPLLRSQRRRRKKKKPSKQRRSPNRSPSVDVVGTSENSYFLLIVVVLRQLKRIESWKKACERAEAEKEKILRDLENSEMREGSELYEIVSLSERVAQDKLRRAELNESLYAAQFELRYGLIETWRSRDEARATGRRYLEAKNWYEQVATEIAKTDARALRLNKLVIDYEISDTLCSLQEEVKEQLDSINVELKPAYERYKRAELLLNFAAFDLVLEWNLQRGSKRASIVSPQVSLQEIGGWRRANSGPSKIGLLLKRFLG